MTFLITGANGFVGSNLRGYLEGKGHRVLRLDLSDADYGWSELERIPFGEIDCVVHLAGKAHDLKKVAGEQAYFDINVGLTERIYGEMAKQVGEEARRRVFIYFSSSKADPNGNAYGRSKYAAEEWLKGHSPVGSSGLTVAILRPAMIHGPGNKGNLNLLWGIARRGIPWPLAAFENLRSFTSIGNVCAAVEALASSAALPALGIYPIADDEMLSTNRLIELIAETCGRKAKLWRLPRGLMRFAARVGDVLHLPLNTERIEKLTEDSFVDNSELRRTLGWTKMPISAEDGMRSTLRSFLKGV